jgi:hypothetical protein
MNDKDDLIDSRGHRPGCTDVSVEPRADPGSVYLNLFWSCHDWSSPRILSNSTDVAWPQLGVRGWPMNGARQQRLAASMRLRSVARIR